MRVDNVRPFAHQAPKDCAKKAPTTAKIVCKDDARRFAANVAKLSELLRA